MNYDDALLDRYLLGRTSEEETDALELRLLEDPDFAETLQAAEFELVERYARGQLAADEGLALTARLHGSPRLREVLAFSRSLIDIARQQKRPSLLKRLPALLSVLWAPAARPAWTAAAVASIGAVWLGSQNVDLRRELDSVAGIEGKVVALEQQQQSTLEQLAQAQEQARRSSESEQRFRAEYAQRQQRSSERESRARKVVTVSLTATTRSGESETKLLVARDQTHALIELDLPATVGTAALLALVRRDGVTVWTESDFAVERSSAGVIGSFEMPRQSLVTGRYEIEVRSQSGTVATFPLTVERPQP